MAALTEAQWNSNKDHIVRLVLFERAQYSDVARRMKKRHGFNASIPMYKKRLSKWGIRKNATRTEKEALLFHVSARKIRGEDTVILRNGVEWDSERLSRFERDETRAGLSKADVKEAAAENIAIPDGYTLMTPPPHGASDTMVEDLQSPHPSAANTSASEPSNMIHQEDPELDSHHDHPRQASVPPQTDVLALRSQDRCGVQEVKDRFQPVNLNASVEPGPVSKLFLELCCAACTFCAQGQLEVANNVVWQASEIFASMIYSNFDALTCLSVLQITLSMQGRSAEVANILRAARTAALATYRESDPFIVMLSFMIWQTSTTREDIVAHVTQLRTAREQFAARLGLKHPYTIVAGYELAWRLAKTETCAGSKRQALTILNDLQFDADEILTPLHIQSIAITTTKARVLEDLGLPGHSESIMTEGFRRQRLALPAWHPYRLEGMSRLGLMLQKRGEMRQAEEALREAALGKVETLGRAHRFSVASIDDVRHFLENGNRAEDLQLFDDELSAAEERSHKRLLVAGF